MRCEALDKGGLETVFSTTPGGPLPISLDGGPPSGAGMVGMLVSAPTPPPPRWTAPRGSKGRRARHIPGRWRTAYRASLGGPKSRGQWPLRHGRHAAPLRGTAATQLFLSQARRRAMLPLLARTARTGGTAQTKASAHRAAATTHPDTKARRRDGTRCSTSSPLHRAPDTGRFTLCPQSPTPAPTPYLWHSSLQRGPLSGQGRPHPPRGAVGALAPSGTATAATSIPTPHIQAPRTAASPFFGG